MAQTLFDTLVISDDFTTTDTQGKVNMLDRFSTVYDVPNDTRQKLFQRAGVDFTLSERSGQVNLDLRPEDLEAMKASREFIVEPSPLEAPDPASMVPTEPLPTTPTLSALIGEGLFRFGVRSRQTFQQMMRGMLSDDPSFRTGLGEVGEGRVLTPEQQAQEDAAFQARVQHEEDLVRIADLPNTILPGTMKTAIDISGTAGAVMAGTMPVSVGISTALLRTGTVSPLFADLVGDMIATSIANNTAFPELTAADIATMSAQETTALAVSRLVHNKMLALPIAALGGLQVTPELSNEDRLLTATMNAGLRIVGGSTPRGTMSVLPKDRVANALQEVVDQEAAAEAARIAGLDIMRAEALDPGSPLKLGEAGTEVRPEELSVGLEGQVAKAPEAKAVTGEGPAAFSKGFEVVKEGGDFRVGDQVVFSGDSPEEPLGGFLKVLAIKEDGKLWFNTQGPKGPMKIFNQGGVLLEVTDGSGAVFTMPAVAAQKRVSRVFFDPLAESTPINQARITALQGKGWVLTRSAEGTELISPDVAASLMIENNVGKSVLEELGLYTTGERRQSGYTTAEVRALIKSDHYAGEEDIAAIREWVQSPERAAAAHGSDAFVQVIKTRSAYQQFTHWRNEEAVNLDRMKGKLLLDEVDDVRLAMEAIRSGDPELYLPWQEHPRVYQSALEMNQWFDNMRTKYQLYKRQMYNKAIGPTASEALDDILIRGKSINEAAEKHLIPEDEIQGMLDDVERIKQWGLDDYVTRIQLGNYRVLDEADNSTIAVGTTRQKAIKEAREYINDKLTDDPTYKPSLRVEFGKEIGGDFGHLGESAWFDLRDKILKGMKDEITEFEKGLLQEFPDVAIKKIIEKAMDPAFDKAVKHLLPDPTKHRKGVLPPSITQSIFDQAHVINHVMHKRMFLTPARAEMEAAIQEFPPNVKELLRNQMNAYVEGARDPFTDALDNAVSAVVRKVPFAGDRIDHSKLLTSSIGLARRGTSMALLGARIAGGVLNYTAGQLNTFFQVGSGPYKRAWQMLDTDEGKQILREGIAHMGFDYAIDDAARVKGHTKWYDPTLAFTWAEKPNREISYLANYYMAREAFEMSHEASHMYARSNLAFQQFMYDVGSLPKIMRAPILKLPFQFRTYILKSAELLANSTPRQLARFVTGATALGGPATLLYMASALPLLTDNETLAKAQLAIENEYPLWARGLYGMFGADAAKSFAILFPERKVTELLGPGPSLVFRVIGALEQDFLDTGYYDTDKAKSDTGEELVGMTPFMSRVSQALPRSLFFADVLNGKLDSEGWVRDRAGARRYQLNQEWISLNNLDEAQITPDQVLMILGFLPKQAKTQRKILDLAERQKADRKGLVNILNFRVHTLLDRVEGKRTFLDKKTPEKFEKWMSETASMIAENYVAPEAMMDSMIKQHVAREMAPLDRELLVKASRRDQIELLKIIRSQLITPEMRSKMDSVISQHEEFLNELNP